MAPVKPDNKAALAFLQRWAPEGPWVLTAIQADRKAIATATFRPASLHQLEQWLEQYNGHRNIYFHVNPVLRDVTKKAEREDIRAVAWLHVDIDPRAGEDLQAERERALALLTTRLPQGVPEPTCVVFSGGGYQGFWRLEQPIQVDGDLAKAEDAKRYNQQLEILFAADNCHNIDRIMRLPGTVNIPDARKLKKGRQPALAELVSFNDHVYPLSRFTPAPVVQMPEERGFGGGATVKVSGNVERLAGIEELDQWGVPDRVKVIIVQGKHPDEVKEGDNSRSAWLFDAICQLVRAGVPDDIIFSVVTDPEFSISESVLDKGANAEKYAIRQIERAKEEVEDPWLRKLNEQFAVIGNIGGKCRVIEEVLDPALRRTRLTRQSFDDFRNRFMHQRTQVGDDPKTGLPIMMQVGKWWLQHQHRRQYETIVFAPGHEVKGAYNMWKGFACQSRPGDCSLFITHIRENICQGDETLFIYVMGWLARLVQHPDTPGEVAIVLRGGRGVGKSFFAKIVGHLLGRHFLQVSNPSHLIGNFNAHLRDVVLLFADEAFYAGDKRHSSILKTLITEETITIEAKGVDAEASPNYVHLIMASNDMHVVPAGGDERRFLVLDVGKGHQQDAGYFGEIIRQMESGGYEALLHMLLTYDLSGYEVRDVPRTEALLEQKLLSLSLEEEWWYNKLLEGRLLLEDRWQREVVIKDLFDDYIAYTRKLNTNRRSGQTALGRFLHRVVPGLGHTQRIADRDIQTGEGWTRTVRERTRFYTIDSLEGCRRRWEELYGRQEWPEAPGAQGELPQPRGGGTPF